MWKSSLRKFSNRHKKCAEYIDICQILRCVKIIRGPRENPAATCGKSDHFSVGPKVDQHNQVAEEKVDGERGQAEAVDHARRVHPLRVAAHLGQAHVQPQAQLAHRAHQLGARQQQAPPLRRTHRRLRRTCTRINYCQDYFRPCPFSHLFSSFIPFSLHFLLLYFAVLHSFLLPYSLTYSLPTRLLTYSLTLIRHLFTYLFT